jgi:hypothetical protein
MVKVNTVTGLFGEDRTAAYSLRVVKQEYPPLQLSKN